MKVGYFDCFSGAAGDMIVGACLDAGASEEFLREQLDRLGLHEVELQIKKVNKNGIAATAFFAHSQRPQSTIQSWRSSQSFSYY